MNMAEILEDAPEGTGLYGPLFGEVELESAGDGMMKVGSGVSIPVFCKDGGYCQSYPDGECLSFPSEDKGNRDNVRFLKDKAPVTASDDGYGWRLGDFRDGHAADLPDKDGDIVACCHWNHAVPISGSGFEGLHSNILDALQ